MKKLYTIIFCTFVMCTAAVSQSFDYNFIMPQITFARDRGMGSAYLTDTTTYFSFLSNPASLALTGDRNLYPIINTRVAGPLEIIPEIIDTAQSEDPDFLGLISKTLTGSTGINFATDIAGPLCFGAIRKGFGWGFFNETYLSFDMPSLFSATAYGGNESLLRFGYGYPIKLPVPLTISVGLSADLVNKVEGFYRMNAFDLIGLAMGEDVSFASFTIPVYTTLGYGLDAGITLKAFNIISLSYVWDDFFYGQYIKRSNQAEKILEDPSNFTSYLWTSAQTKTNIGASKNMAAGLGVDIPIADVSKNFISSWIFMVDCNDLISTFSNDPRKRHPILEFSAGTEIVFFKTIILRFGLDEMYPAAGIGIRLGAFNIDASIFGQELGSEPGSRPQLNTAFSIGFYK